MKLFLIILIILIAAAALLGFALQSFATGIRGQTYEEARKWQEDHYDLSWYDPLRAQDDHSRTLRLSSHKEIWPA